MHRIRRDTVNERAVCILLEYILVVLSINRETLRGGNMIHQVLGPIYIKHQC